MLKAETQENDLLWQQTMEILEESYSVTKTFPKEEFYGLLGQIKYSAHLILTSSEDNYDRKTVLKYIKYFNQSLELLADLENYLILSVKMRLCTSRKIQPILDLSDQLRKIIIKLLIKLSKKSEFGKKLCSD